MADEHKPEEKPEHPPEAKPEAKPEEAHAANQPAQPAAAQPAAPEMHPLEPHEDHFARRMLHHYGCTPEAMKYVGEQHRKYEASQAAMAPASPTNGTTPATPLGAEQGTPTNKHEDEADMMSDPELQRQYEETQKFLLEENAKLYADREYDKIVRVGIKKSTLGKFKDNLIKLRTDMTRDAKGRDAACAEYLEEVKNNYARETRPPTGRDFLPVAHEEPTMPTSSDAADIDQSDPEVVDAISRYAATNKIDLVGDDDGWGKAVEGFAAAQKKKRDRQSA